VEGAPEEVGAAGAAAGMDTAVARRQLRQLEARAAAEEDLMMRVPLSKVRAGPGRDNSSASIDTHRTALFMGELCAHWLFQVSVSSARLPSGHPPDRVTHVRPGT